MTAPRLKVLRGEAPLTAGQHLLEAQRLLYLADAELRGQEPAPADRALLALAHALTALAADAIGGAR